MMMTMPMFFVNHINRKENYTTEKVNQKEEYLLKFSQEKIKMARKAKKAKNTTWKQNLMTLIL